MPENKEFYVRSGGQLVPVTEEVYRFYYRSKRRERYFEHDIKIETALRDRRGNVVGYRPAKEDSLDRLMETGEDYADECESVEDAVIRAMMSDKLREVLKLLPESDRELINALFFSNGGEGMTERDYAAHTGIAQKNVNKKKQRVLLKLKYLLTS